MKTPERIFSYLLCLPFSLVLSAGVWLLIAPGRLYYCWDDAPPFVISWFPPFIHPKASSMDGELKDYYLWPEWTVYGVWLGLIGLAFLLPALAVRLLESRKWAHPKTPGTAWR